MLSVGSEPASLHNVYQTTDAGGKAINGIGLAAYYHFSLVLILECTLLLPLYDVHSVI